MLLIAVEAHGINGVAVPIPGDSSSGDLGRLSVFEASDPLFLGDAMVLTIFFRRVIQRPKCMSIRCATQDGNKKIVNLAREEVGFRRCAPAADGEEDRE
nr:unnamed protein product [Digitaria exilis]CAB3498870.1 unnamed protein product [Digitaria exilis]